jgi:hypothetical protein
MSREDDLKTIQMRIIDAKARMSDCLSARKLREAESFLDQLRSLERMLELAA